MRRGSYGRVASWWLSVLVYLALIAGGVALSVWAFTSGHWIVGSVIAAWTLWWAVRVVSELELARTVRRLLRLS